MNKPILLIEDDPQESSGMKTAIERHFTGFEVQIVETEHEFRQTLAGLGEDCPWSLVISEAMITWAFADPDQPEPPPEVKLGTFKQGGTRCWSEFRRKFPRGDIPWVYFTVLNKEHFNFPEFSGKRTFYMNKSLSWRQIQRTIEAIQRLLAQEALTKK